MNDVDRWVNLEGPEPEGIRDLLDASSEVPDPTPEEEARLDLRLHAAIAEDRRRWARRRTMKRALVWGLMAACLASVVVVLALRLAAQSDLALARRLLPNATQSVPNHLGGTDGPTPSASGSARPAPRSPKVGPHPLDR